MKEKLEEIQNLLNEARHNAGDIRGCNGEYISDSITMIQTKVDDMLDLLPK